MTVPIKTESSGIQLRGSGILLLVTLCGAAFLEGIDVAMFNVALPVIRADLGLATTQLQWILSGYVIAYGGFMILGGRVGDRFGRRRVFLTALAVFILFSLSGGMAHEGWMLIAARFATGVAAAFMMPTGLSIITTGFAEGAPRNRAVLIYAGIGAAGFSLGLVAGGLLTVLGWRWVFFAPVVLGIVILVGGSVLIPRDAAEMGETPFDVFGAVALTTGIVLTVLAVEQATHGIGPVVVLAAAGAATAFVGFGIRQRRAIAPLIPASFLRARALLRAYVGGASLAAGSWGSSSSSCSTCRNCAAGRRCRPRWPWSSSRSTRSSPPPSRRASSPGSESGRLRSAGSPSQQSHICCSFRSLPTGHTR